MSRGDLVDRFRLLVAACCDQSLSPAARSTLAQILDHYNGKTGRCSPSLERLARTTGISRRSVIRAVNDLQQAGWIDRSRTRTDEGGAYGCNSFRPAFERAGKALEVVTAQSLGGDSPVTTPSDEAVTRGSDKTVPEVVTGLSPKPSKRTKERRTKGTPPTPSRFSEFFEAYPRKAGRQAAEAAFDRIITTGKASADELIAGARRYADEQDDQEARFIKEPRSWLAGGHWLDEPAPKRQAVRGSFDAFDYLADRMARDD